MPAFDVGQTVYLKRIPEQLARIVSVTVDEELVDGPHYDLVWTTGEAIGRLSTRLPESELVLWAEPPTHDLVALEHWLVNEPVWPTFQCPVCKKTTYNPNDIKHGFCSYCNDYTSVEQTTLRNEPF